MKNLHKINENIYITSDEEIRDLRPHKGKWHLEKEQILNKFPDYLTDLSECKLIILTTDQELIKNGIQPIPDEFLEWFIKNPSCDEIEFEKFHGINTSIAEVNTISGDGSLNWEGKSDLRDYKIIIPKEEPKKDLEKEMFDLEQELDIPSHLRWHNSKPKQETLEEVLGSSMCQFSVIENKLAILYRNQVKIYDAITKEQDKKMYSEEEILDITKQAYGMGRSNYTIKAFNEWFEQFKNK
jgi:hypothetical protein